MASMLNLQQDTAMHSYIHATTSHKLYRWYRLPLHHTVSSHTLTYICHTYLMAMPRSCLMPAYLPKAMVTLTPDEDNEDDSIHLNWTLPSMLAHSINTHYSRIVSLSC